MPTSIKFQTFTTDAGHTPNYGDVSADFRGSLAIGSAQGDEHHTFAEIKNASETTVQFFLSAGPIMNQRARDASIGNLVKTIEANLPEAEKHVIEALTAALGGIPTVRVGVWDPHG